MRYLNALHADHVVLECAHRPPEELAVFKDLKPEIGFGLGVVDIKATEVESADAVARAIERAEQMLGAGRVKLHPPRLRLLDAEAPDRRRQDPRPGARPRPVRRPRHGASVGGVRLAGGRLPDAAAAASAMGRLVIGGIEPSRRPASELSDRDTELRPTPMLADARSGASRRGVNNGGSRSHLELPLRRAPPPSRRLAAKMLFSTTWLDEGREWTTSRSTSSRTARSFART